MKKITKIVALLAMSAVAFTSCDGLGAGNGETAYASIEKVTMEEKTDGTFFGRFDITCDEEESIKEVTATYTYGTTDLSVPAANIDITKGQSYEWTVKVTTPVEVEGVRVTKMTISATLKGTDGTTKTQSFETPNADEPGETELGAATAFMFKRAGTTVSGDLSTFGLEWKSNTRAAINANITKGAATKMVKLADNAWTTITTKEALKTAVDAAADMATFNEISADATKAYSINLGVINGGVYYILNITNGKVTTGQPAGTTIEITGNYKK